MTPSQKFEEIHDCLRLGCTWLDEAEDPHDPYVIATWELLNTFARMVNGDEGWQSVYQVMDQIEKNHPEVA